MCPLALQDLEPQQLLLFVQSFGIPVSSMSKLLQHLDQAVGHDPQTLEQSIMDKSEPGPGVCRVGGGRASTARSGTPRRQHAVWGSEDGRCLVLAEGPVRGSGVSGKHGGLHWGGHVPGMFFVWHREHCHH